MIIEKQSKDSRNVEVICITLLTVEEAKAWKDNIPPVNDFWWLRTPGCISFTAACVRPDGNVNANGAYVYGDGAGVRPALRINSSSANLEIREKVRACGYTWTYIAEGVLLCDEIVRRMPFRKDWEEKDANKYEFSDVKAYLDDEFRKASSEEGAGRCIKGLSFTLTFDRPVSAYYFNPGGYHGKTTDGSDFGFDFWMTRCVFEGNNVKIDHATLNRDAFPDSDKLQPEDIGFFTDFHVGPRTKNNIRLVNVSPLTFTMSTGEKIEVPAPDKDAWSDLKGGRA